MKKYTIPVNLTTTITVEVKCDDLDDARANAEFDAFCIFSTLMANGELYPGDFIPEAQEP